MELHVIAMHAAKFVTLNRLVNVSVNVSVSLCADKDTRIWKKDRWICEMQINLSQSAEFKFSGGPTVLIWQRTRN